MNVEIKLLDKQAAQEKEHDIILLMKELMHDLKPDALDRYCASKYRDMLKFVEDSTAIVFGGFSQNVLIAYAWGYLRESEGRERLHITQIVVNERYRGWRIGGKLLVCMEKYAQSKKWQGMELNVDRRNYSARKFYEKNGFACEKLFLYKNL